MEFKSFFKTVGGNEGNKCHYPTRLDTYGCGCQHDCKYCYAKSLLDFRKLWNAAQPAIVNIQKVHRTIRRNLKAGDIVRLGGMTDCFQPLERTARATYRTIEELNRQRVGYLIVTKSEIVADDEYMELMDKDLAHIQVTVTCTDDEFNRTYERATVPMNVPPYPATASRPSRNFSGQASTWLCDSRHSFRSSSTKACSTWMSSTTWNATRFWSSSCE